MQKDVGSSMVVGGNSNGLPGSFRLIKKNPGDILDSKSQSLHLLCCLNFLT